MALSALCRFSFFLSVFLPVSSVYGVSLPSPLGTTTLDSTRSLNSTKPVSALPVTVCMKKPTDPFKPLSQPTYCELSLSEMRTDFEHAAFPQYWGPPRPPYTTSTFKWQSSGARGCRVVVKPQKWGDVGYFSVAELENAVRVLLRRCHGQEVGADGPWGYGGLRTVGRDGEGAMGREDRIRRWVVYLYNATTGQSPIDGGGRAHFLDDDEPGSPDLSTQEAVSE